MVFVHRPQGKACAKADHTDHNDIAKHSILLSTPPQGEHSGAQGCHRDSPGAADSFFYFTAAFLFSEQFSG